MQKDTNSKKAGATRRYVKALLASTALASASMAYSQTDTTKETENSSSNQPGSIEEVIVRGVARQYRPEDSNAATGLDMKLIDTPQSISVLTSEMLETIGAASVYEAADLVPGLERAGDGFGEQGIFLRGVVDDAFHRINGLESPSIDVTIDGYMAERLEIVRGPASVIYGVTGAFGGEINTVLKRPEEDGYTEFGFEYANYDSQTYKFDTTGVLPGTNDALRGRLTVNFEDLGLPYDIKGDNDIRRERFTAMASLSWDITPQTTVTAWYYHQDRDGDLVDGSSLVLLPSGQLALPQDAFPDRVDPDTWYHAIPGDNEESYSTNVFLGEIVHTFDNDWQAKANVMVGKFDYENHAFFTFGPFGHYALADDQAYLYTYDFFRGSKDLTFNMSLGGDFELFGREHSFYAAFEHKENIDPFFRQEASEGVGFVDIDTFADNVFDGVTPRLSDGTPFTSALRTGDLTSSGKIKLQEDTDNKFSFQVLLRPFDRVELLAGFLVHDGNQVFVETRAAGGVFPTTPSFERDTDYTEVIQRYGITFDLAEEGQYLGGYLDDARLYVSYSEGFEPEFSSTALGVPVFLPREMETYEVGLKGEFFDGAVGAAIAYYNYEIENIKTSSSSLGNITGIAGSQGIQDAQGVEVEVLGELLPGWNMAFNYAWFDGEITSTEIDPATNQLRFPFSAVPRSTPEYQATMTTTYEFLEGALQGLRVGGTLRISGDYAFNDSLRLLTRFSPPGTTPASFITGGHERLDLMADYTGFTGALQGVKLYVNVFNVFDTEVIKQKASHPGFAVPFVDRRSIKVGFTYSFN